MGVIDWFMIISCLILLPYLSSELKCVLFLPIMRGISENTLHTKAASSKPQMGRRTLLIRTCCTNYLAYPDALQYV